MRLFRWGKDVNDTGYRIFTLAFSKTLGIDIYLFHYKKGSYIPKHKDPKKNLASAEDKFEAAVKQASANLEAMSD